jgi:hypothetical protein
MKKLVRIQLLHRDKVALSCLRMVRKHGNFMMTAMQLRHLEELHERIVGVLGTPLEHDVDQVDHEADEPPGDEADDGIDFGDFPDGFTEPTTRHDQPQLTLTLHHHHHT